MRDEGGGGRLASAPSAHQMAGEMEHQRRDMTSNRPEALLRQRQAEVAAKEAEQREQAQQERLRRRSLQLLAMVLDVKVGGPLRIFVGEYNSEHYDAAGLAYGDDRRGRIWVAYERREGSGACRTAELQFLAQDDRSVQISAAGQDFRAPATEVVAVDALTPDVVERHFKEFLAAALA